MSSPLASTFAGTVGRWRVVDKQDEPDRPVAQRFAVMALPLGMPAPTGIDDPNFEFELCAVQYRPHALAIAALPELARAADTALEFLERDERLNDVCHTAATYLRDAIAKAEGRAE